MFFSSSVRLLGRIQACVGIFLVAVACGAAWAVKPAPAPTTTDYEHFCTGLCSDPALKLDLSANKASTPSYVLMGGGPDVDEAFRWMIKQAGVRPGTGGRFVVIRVTGTDAYDPYIYYSDANHSSGAPADGWVGGAGLGLGSAETLIIRNRAGADASAVIDILSKANAVFIAGGDQGDYIRYWKGSKVEGALNKLMSENVPIGGTSAGLAVLGQFDFAALNGTVSSKQALSDPYNKYMSFDPLASNGSFTRSGGFLAPPALFNVIFDSHLDSRDRMGRFLTFLAREVGATASTSGCPGGILNAGQPSLWTSLAFGASYPDNVARGIGIGVETALLVSVRDSDKHVLAERVTNPGTTTASAAYFLSLGSEPTKCAKGVSLSVPKVQVQRVDAGKRQFDLSTWTGGWSYPLEVIDGKITSNQVY